MKLNKNIDQLFQEKLKGLDIAPPDIVWERIEKSLDNKKRRQIIIPIWLRIGSAAAILLLISITSIRYFNHSNINPNQDIIISNSDKIVLPENDIDLFKKPIIKPPSNEEVIVMGDKREANNPIINNTPLQKNSSKSIQYKNINTSEKNNNHIIVKETKKTPNYMKGFDNKKVIVPRSENSIAKKNNPIDKETVTNTKLNEEDKNSDEEPVIVVKNLIDTLENPMVIPKEESLGDSKKWSVAPIAGPVFFNSFNKNGSPIDPKFNNSSIQSKSTISYGVKLNYALNKKFTLQSGVNIVSLGYSINNVFITAGIDKNASLNISNVNNSLIIEPNPFDTAPLAKKETSSFTATEGVLNQEFGYIEIPLEIKYTLVDKKFGLDILAGFSSLILNENRIFVETESGVADFGGASNLNKINFTGNIGVDVDYKINKNMFINVAPILKIQANTFSEKTEGFKPYFIGIYTGLNYTF